MIYDLAIIGGGPAAVAAGVYASRKKLKTVFVTKDFQSQSAVSSDIQNWIGEKHISGFDLAKKFEEHVRNFPGVVDIKTFYSLYPGGPLKISSKVSGIPKPVSCI